MTSIIILIGAVLVVAGVYRFLTAKNEDVNDDSHVAIVVEETPVVEEEPVVVVNNVVVETKTETPKAEPVAETSVVKAPAKKKPYRKPKPKTPTTTK
jgi:hypothetical protein